MEDTQLQWFLKADQMTSTHMFDPQSQDLTSKEVVTKKNIESYPQSLIVDNIDSMIKIFKLFHLSSTFHWHNQKIWNMERKIKCFVLQLRRENCHFFRIWFVKEIKSIREQNSIFQLSPKEIYQKFWYKTIKHCSKVRGLSTSVIGPFVICSPLGQNPAIRDPF